MFGFFKDKTKLIEFNDGTFGILNVRFIFDNQYLGTDQSWWTIEKYVNKYCRFKTADDALDAYHQYLAKTCKEEYKIISDITDEWDSL